MKKTIVLSLLICLAATATAQTDSVGYKSIFGHESTVWNGATACCAGNYVNHELHATIDTMIDGVAYKKIEYYLEYPEEHVRDPYLDFFVREDTLEGKVWCRYTESALETTCNNEYYTDTDYLIMDMSLEVGDSIMLPRMHGCILYSDLLFVSSVTYVDSAKHISLAEEDWYDVLEFEEGVCNLIGYVFFDQHDNKLVCCHKDGDLVYHNVDTTNPYHEYSGCLLIDHNPYIGSIADNDETSTISVWPNPCSNWFRVDGENINDASLWDMKGNMILSAINTKEPVNMTDFANGVYFLRIMYGDVVSFKTIIKN